MQLEHSMQYVIPQSCRIIFESRSASRGFADICYVRIQGRSARASRVEVDFGQDFSAPAIIPIDACVQK
jgi:hypothetical protein